MKFNSDFKKNSLGFLMCVYFSADMCLFLSSQHTFRCALVCDSDAIIWHRTLRLYNWMALFEIMIDSISIRTQCIFSIILTNWHSTCVRYFFFIWPANSFLPYFSFFMNGVHAHECSALRAKQYYNCIAGHSYKLRTV